MIAPPSPNETIEQRLARVRHRLQQARQAAQRTDKVDILAVSKGHPASAIHAMAMLGQQAFGENYLQPALEKQHQLTATAGKLARSIVWHYIGAIQSNKTREIAEHFDWAQSIDRIKIAQRLSAQRPTDRMPLSVLIQVNIDGEPQKAGIAPSAALELAQVIESLPGLQLRGLMGLPRPSDDAHATRDSFARLRLLFQQVKTIGATVDTLSMGMSADLELAVAEGSTMIRIGTALFGPRPPINHEPSTQ